MKPEDSIIKMLQALQNKGIISTEDFVKDITRLVNSDIKEFITKFYKDITRSNLRELKRYERLKLTKVQNNKMKGNSLFRYEYRNTSNLRCIYVIQNENTEDKSIILLCAFNEDARKG